MSSLFLIRIPAYFTLCFVVISCGNRPSEGSKQAGEHIKQTISAVVETDPTPQNKNEDSADDPAIWINSIDPMQSVVIGTDKKGGLITYNLDGKKLNYYADGKMNNTDLRYNFKLGNATIDILAASNRTTHSVALYSILPGGKLKSIHARIIKSQMLDDVYGLCMYKSSKTGNFYVFMNSKAGEIEQWELFENNNAVDAKLVRSMKLQTQTEGMVADDEFTTLYVGEEVAGIYKFDAEPDGSKQSQYISMSSEENENIKFDLEGLALHDSGNGQGYIIASSQGNYSYAVFDREGNNEYLGSFRIVDGLVDSVEETDGIEVTNVPLGDKFPKGMFVVQDGYNYDGKELKSQNFKYLSWQDIEKLVQK